MTLRSRRTILALGILVLWLGVVATHVRREYFKAPELRLELGARALAPGAEFYVVRMEGTAIGVGSSRLDTIPDGFLLDDALILDVPAMGAQHRAVTRTRIELTRGLALKSFDYSLDSELGRFGVRGAVEEDSVLAVVVEAGGEPERLRIPLGEDPLLPAVLPLRLAAAGELREGRSRRVRLFDPSTLDGRDVEFHITDIDTLIVPDTAIHDPETRRWRVGSRDTVAAWRVEEAFAGVRVTSWLDEDGRVVRAESPMGMTLERTAYELAQQEWEDARTDLARADGYGAIIESTAIASNVRVGAGEDAAERLAVRLLGVDLHGFDLTGGRQTLRGDTLYVAREDAATIEASYRLPYTGADEPARWLESTALIQATDPRIVEQARRIVGEEDDPVQVARLLGEWVYDAVEKEITPEHAERGPGPGLAARRLQRAHGALRCARPSAGLPARTAAGLVRHRRAVLLPCVAGGLARTSGSRSTRRSASTRPTPSTFAS